MDLCRCHIHRALKPQLSPQLTGPRGCRLAAYVQDAVDPQAYGTAPLMPRCTSERDFNGSEASFATDSAYEAAGEDGMSASPQQQPLLRAGAGAPGALQRSPSLRRLGVMVLASGVALAIARTGSSSSLAGGERQGSAQSGASGTSGAPAQGAKHRSSKKHHGAHRQHHSSGYRRRSEVATLAAVPE